VAASPWFPCRHAKRWAAPLHAGVTPAIESAEAAESSRNCEMSVIQRAYKTELELHHEQITACKRHAGAARWAYNWGLSRKQESYHATGQSPTAIDLHRELNALKPTGVPWLYQVSKCAPQEALRNLDAAFAHFFRRCQLKKQGKLRG
jgi:putative transposase